MFFLVEEVADHFADVGVDVAAIVVKPYKDGLCYVCYNEIPKMEKIKDDADMMTLPCRHRSRSSKGPINKMNRKCPGCTFVPKDADRIDFEITITSDSDQEKVLAAIRDFMSQAKLTLGQVVFTMESGFEVADGFE